MAVTKDKRLIEQARNALARVATKPGDFQVFVGFDGFVDEIIHIVDKRLDFETYTRVDTIAQFGERISRAAGFSTNLELIPKQIKLGGNGPIMANALRNFGVSLTYSGCIGYPDIHPVFRELADGCETYSISEPGHTDALEFTDGKLMMGKIEILKEVNWTNIVDRISTDKLIEVFSRSQLVSMLNWTMIPYMTDIWRKILEIVLPKATLGNKPFAFFDLCDPEKRNSEDLVEAMAVLQEFQDYYKVILGLNRKEASAIATVLDIGLSNKPEAVSLEEITEAIAKRLDIYCVVVHPVAEAGTVVDGEYFHVNGPYTADPKLTTGAGDNFNAGFCFGQVLGLAPEECLVAGTGTSGFYVRNMRSPSFHELIEFLDLWADKIGVDF